MDNKKSHGFGVNTGSSSDFSDAFLGGDFLGGYDGTVSQDNNDNTVNSDDTSSYVQQNTPQDYSNNGFGTYNNTGSTNNFGEAEPYGQQNTPQDYSNNGFGTYNNASSTNNFGEAEPYGQRNTPQDYSNNGFGTYNNTGSTNNFGEATNFGHLSQETHDNYDPNAMFSDSGSGLYGNTYDPNAMFSSSYHNPVVSTSTTVKRRNSSSLISIIIIIVAIAIGVAVFFYVTNNKKSLKQWSETADGKSNISSLRSALTQTMASDPSMNFTIDCYVRGEDQLVMEYKSNTMLDISDYDLPNLKAYLDSRVNTVSYKIQAAHTIKKLRESADIKEFSLVLEFLNADENVLYQLEIHESDG